jgi:CRISPR-associated protein Csy1
LYWLTGDDATDDAQYLLLAPLYATSLAHEVFAQVQDARFGEANRIARQARRDGSPHNTAYREYRDLAVQKIGGSKPQNISQLNSERGGNNYLLASLPPTLRHGQRVRLPVNAGSVFEQAFGARTEVDAGLRALQSFLLGDPTGSESSRVKIDRLVDRLIDELVAYAGGFRRTPAGWTRDPSFGALADEEKLWLDPLRAELPDEREFASRWLSMDWPSRIGERFGKWLNEQSQERLPAVGYSVSRQWRRILLGEDDSWAQQLRDTRKRLDAPDSVSFCKSAEELTAPGSAV